MIKRFVKLLKSESGYTLAEMLFSFSVWLYVVTLIAMFIPFIYVNTQFSNEVEEKEWEIFLHQSKLELRGARQITAVNQRLTFINFSNERVDYEQYGQLIRRRVDGKGHEILLHFVQSVEFKKQANHIEISVRTVNKQKFSAKIYVIPSSS